MGAMKIVAKSELSLIEPYLSYWYLLALIVWRLSISFLSKINGYILFPISLFVAFLIGCLSEFTNILALSRIFAFFPFFLMGYYLDYDFSLNFLKKRTLRCKITGLIFLLSILTFTWYYVASYPLTIKTLCMYSYISTFNIDTFANLLGRIFVYLVSCSLLICFFLCLPNRKIPFITQWGVNSLAIYVLHRYIPILFGRYYHYEQLGMNSLWIIPLISLFLTFILGSNFVMSVINLFFNWMLKILSPENKTYIYRIFQGLIVSFLSIFILFILTIQQIMKDIPDSVQFYNRIPFVQKITKRFLPDKRLPDCIYPKISDLQQKQLKNSVKISFIGDLILLRDVVRSAYMPHNDSYDFSYLFQYTNKYLLPSDLTMAVFEGPMAGKEVGYSSSNFNDGILVRLNYPDSFADAVKNAGIDFVTTANNHLLDKEEAGAMRTLDILDKYAILHTGSWRNREEKLAPCIVKVGNFNIGVLAYTYGQSEDKCDNIIIRNPDLTSIIVNPDCDFFAQNRKNVLADFERLKHSVPKPDLIVVMPHMGKEFTHVPNKFQNTWNNVFKEAGADIILSDHVHAVQPIEFVDNPLAFSGNGRSLIVHCPGNFANSYIDHDGDASAIVECYLDSSTREIICVAIIPLITRISLDAKIQAIPIYDIHSDELRKTMNKSEMERVNEALSVITKTMIHKSIPFDMMEDRLFYFPQKGYIRHSVKPMTLDDHLLNSKLYTLLKSVNSICFLGDSVTNGTKNGGYGWFEPIMATMPEKNVFNFSYGGGTVKTLLNHLEDIASCNADLYVIAIGTNDIRYRNANICSMNESDYINNIDILVKYIKSKHSSAQFVFVSPWPNQMVDPFMKIPFNECNQLFEKYTDSLKKYCQCFDYLFIDPSKKLKTVLANQVPSEYLLDHIHPNPTKGIYLYSEKVLECSGN